MSFQKRIKYFLVKNIKITNAEADELIEKGEIEIDGEKISKNVFLTTTSQIKAKGEVIRQKKEFIYLKFYKPVGYESTLSPKVENNLSEFFPEFKGLSIAGRLDKASQGLLLLSDDGKWVENITNPEFEKEKEYLVELDKTPTTEFAKTFENGVNIGYHVTKPCTCSLEKDNWIKVILKEGKNRQIRKMCKTLGYDVKTLIRTRVENITLGDLTESVYQIVNI
jgi:23S rRNA pseudouridine2604 synthase